MRAFYGDPFSFFVGAELSEGVEILGFPGDVLLDVFASQR
jgi:hypothetical protein